MGRRVLAVVAHGDDETLGAGGTLAKHAENGDEVGLLVMTSDDGSRFGGGSTGRGRVDDIHRAAKILGIGQVWVGDLGDNRLDQVGQLQVNRRIEAVAAQWRPDLVYTSSTSDLSVDHQLVSRAVRVACRPGATTATELRTFEIRSSTDWGEASGLPERFSPNHWVVLEEHHVAAKVEALEAYAPELQPWPLPRNGRALRTLAEYRGTQIGVAYAEAFQVVRRIET